MSDAIEKLSEEDRLRFNLHLERQMRFASEQTNLQITQQQLHQAMTRFKLEQAAFNNELRIKYSLTAVDTVDASTGSITRAAPVPSPEVKPQAEVG